MRDLTENLAFDLGIVGQTINNTNKTGRYFSMADHRCAVALAIGGDAAATKTTKVEWMQAKDKDGTDAKAVSNSSATGTSGTRDTEATIALGSVANTDVVTVNGIAFTKAAATSGKNFANAAGLAAAIEANCEGLSAAAVTTNVTVTAKDGYSVTLGKTENAGTITLATTKHIVMAEIDEEDLDVANGFEFVAPKITCTGNGVYAVAVIRDSKSVPVTQCAQAKTTL